MRKSRDYDAELKSLEQRAKAFNQRKIIQLGELVITCCADMLPVGFFLGVLLGAITDREQRRWRVGGRCEGCSGTSTRSGSAETKRASRRAETAA